MEKLFKHYQQYSDKELKTIWNNCLFVFDTNFLLDIYRRSRDTADRYLEILNGLNKGKQLWIPHQVGLEFHKNRIAEIIKYHDTYKQIISLFKNLNKDIENTYIHHPILKVQEINAKVSSIISYIESESKKHPNWTTEDNILQKINELFNNNVGPEYSDEQLKILYKEGDARYEKLVPPGYEDRKDKKGENKYGDFILWCQIIDKAKESNKPIIFITNDSKNDWWLVQHGKTIMPRPQLKEEIMKKANVDFHMYLSDRFIDYYDTIKNSKTKKSVIQEIKNAMEAEEQNRTLDSGNYRMRNKVLHSRRNLSFRIEITRLIQNIREICKQLFNQENEGYLFKPQYDEINFIERRLALFLEDIRHDSGQNFTRLQRLIIRMQDLTIQILNSENSISNYEKNLLQELINRLDNTMFLIREYSTIGNEFS